MSSKDWCGTVQYDETKIRIEIPKKFQELMAIFIEQKILKYVTWQLEEGRHKHIQCFLQFSERKALQWMKNNVSARAHWERKVKKSTAKQASDYCQKSESRIGGPWTYGTLQVSGRRNDLHFFRDRIISGASQRELIMDDRTLPQMMRYGRFADRCRSLFPNFQERVPIVILMIGKTGTGKTRAAFAIEEEKKNIYVRPLGRGGWYDGYDGHSLVILDDFSGAASHTTLCSLLRLLDRHIVTVPIKGAFIQFTPKTIVVTTNNHPRLWYKWTNREDQYDALRRRFNQIHLFDNTPVKILTDPLDVETWWQDYDEDIVLNEPVRIN